MSDRLGLEMWVVCFNPSDFPRQFTARRHTIKRGGETVIDATPIVKKTLPEIRAIMLDLGLYRIPRQDGDDKVIVECWL